MLRKPHNDGLPNCPDCGSTAGVKVQNGRATCLRCKRDLGRVQVVHRKTAVFRIDGFGWAGV